MRNYHRYENGELPETPLHDVERGRPCNASHPEGWACTVCGPHAVHEAGNGDYICATRED
jgi:hypothetical protein